MSTKKYETLVSLYAKEIAECKRLAAIVDTERDAANNAGKGIEDEYEAYKASEQAMQSYSFWSMEYQAACAALTQQIEDEYCEVLLRRRASRGSTSFSSWQESQPSHHQASLPPAGTVRRCVSPLMSRKRRNGNQA